MAKKAKRAAVKRSPSPPTKTRTTRINRQPDDAYRSYGLSRDR